jgi:hypothetical protein
METIAEVLDKCPKNSYQNKVYQAALEFVVTQYVQTFLSFADKGKIKSSEVIP